MSHQAVGWALHALEPDEEDVFLEHLPTCDSCRATVGEAQQTLALIAAGVEQVDPPASLHGSLMAEVARTPQARPPAPDPSAPAELVPSGGRHRFDREERTGGRRQFLGRRGRQIVTGKLALAGALTIGILGFQLYQTSVERDAQTAQAAGLTELIQQLDQPGAQHALLAGPDGTTVAAVLVNGDSRDVYTVALPANAADQTYVLWGLQDGVNPAPLGTFDVLAADPGSRSVGSAAEAEGYAQYAISIEPGRVAPASPTVVVASGQVEI